MNDRPIQVVGKHFDDYYLVTREAKSLRTKSEKAGNSAASIIWVAR